MVSKTVVAPPDMLAWRLFSATTVSGFVDSSGEAPFRFGVEPAVLPDELAG
jgi:hypothetical protein